MAFTPTTNLSLPLIDTGTESGTWGELVDNGLTSYLDIAIAGSLTVTITSADVTLTKTAGTSSVTNIGSTTAQYAILNISGIKSAARNLILPSSSKWYIINNGGSGGYLLTVKGAATTGVTLVDGEEAVVFWDGTDFAKLTNWNGYAVLANTFGFKNRFINGAMMVDQRNSGALQSLGGGSGYAGSAYTLDRWVAFAPGATGSLFTSQRLTSGYGAYTMKLIVTTLNSGTVLGAYQRIESLNCADFTLTTLTYSATLSCDTTQTVTWIAYYPNTADTWTGPGVSSAPSTNATVIATGTWTVGTGTTTYSATFATDLNGSRGLQFLIQRPITANGNFLTISNAQLERGNAVTTFDYRPIGLELMLCQRYYFKTFPQTTPPADNTSVTGAKLYNIQVSGTTAGGGVQVEFPTTMRTTPTTVTTYNPGAGTAGAWYSPSRVAVSGVPVINATSDAGVFVQNPQVAADLVSQICAIHFTAIAEL